MAGPPKKRQKREQKQEGEMPQKKFYRQRAHANPFSDHDLTYPACPAAMNWSTHYPAFVATTATPASIPEADDRAARTEDANEYGHPTLTQPISIADIGCGYGGLLFALAPLHPSTLLLGLEIRTAVTSFVQQKTLALRTQHATTGLYQNASCIRANTMKFLPNFLPRSTLKKIFLCFPDPHFKARKHKARIVSPTLISEYAFVLKPGGKVYTITDVEDLHDWMLGHFSQHESFERVGEEEVEADECVAVMKEETEEGRKVQRNGGVKYVAVWRRVEDPAWP
ncbi:tRNA (guanine-N(7)-)-methyltransferase (tRNA(m7G46)-methyltransferase) [Meristemomyces frigidus]|uniref:tRNA (guanine-N(7)-)-methyltransferase n=1 Tax=Meristemomyces frigidus TaxID=1508187 RepID=A0AAN7TLF4_9PEZI|nr:tRNA (guanine-N(7)-)-methyltransferase (tRNA(m7G46)-methyltransferase) [Meristemomyces frigidus]